MNKKRTGLARRCAAAAVSVLAAVTLTAVFTVSAEDNINIIVNGETVDFAGEQPPVIQKDRTLVPFRTVFEKIGAEVEWVDDLKLCKARYGDTEVTIKIGETTVSVGEEKTVESEVPAQIINGRTMVPLRILSESIGADVRWDGESRTVTVTASDLKSNLARCGVYLGVKNYGNVDKESKESFVHMFYVDGGTAEFSVDNTDNSYSVQNSLEEGKRYEIFENNGKIYEVKPKEISAQGTVTDITESTVTVDGKTVNLDNGTVFGRITKSAGGSTFAAERPNIGDTVKVYGEPAEEVDITFTTGSYDAPVKGEPGVKTLKNFLAEAMEPVGTTLYVYGGGWDWQDEGSAPQTVSIGVPESWVEFFQSQDGNYNYKNTEKTNSYYPFGGYNQYYYAGADCSGYVGRTVYNLMNTESGGAGYVSSSTKMARNLQDKYNYGIWTHTLESDSRLRPGDICSISGHVWICVGVCGDGSVVIVHSTPSESKVGKPGGGVQLSSLGGKNSEAYALADKYMKKYYPLWSDRYDTSAKDYGSYTDFSNENAGRFRWNIDGTVLTDPEGYAGMSAAEVLADLFD